MATLVADRGQQRCPRRVALGKRAAWLFPFILVLGALILFKTQTTILEMLIRNTTDAAIAVSSRLRAWIGRDPRKFYYILAACFIVLIGIIIHQALPTQLLQYSANMANLAALIYPLVLIYLNSKLPRPARAAWWSYEDATRREALGPPHPPARIRDTTRWRS